MRRITPTELRARAFERLRVGVEALEFVSGATALRPERLSSLLLPSSSYLIAARASLGKHDLPRAHAALRAHFLDRRSQFVLGPMRPTAFAEVVHSRFPTASDDARRRGSAIIQGRYDLLGYDGISWLSESGEIDWHFDPVHKRRAPGGFWARVPFLDPQSGDHKVIWELNRHQHWLALGRATYLTGDRRYYAEFTHQLDSWLRENPPLTGINWASMLELGFRSISWIWALHLFLPVADDPADTWLVYLLLGLDRQLDHISRHLSVYFSPNTHLLGEAVALYVAGRVLPELRRAPEWEAVSRRVLVEQAHAQVNADGGHVELSPHYHRYALDFYLLALAVARRTGDPVAQSFADVASRLASFYRAVADDNGQLPTIGDDDGGMLFPICGRRAADARASLALAATLLDRPDLAVGDPPEEVFWMIGDAPPPFNPRPDPPSSQLLPDSGYAVLRTPSQHAIVDVGRFGFLNGGHAHADALSMVLSVRGHQLLIDPGTATYTMDRELRDRYRSSAMHNTVVVDGRSQAQPAGPFLWHDRPAATPTRWSSGARYDCIEGQHDGYLPQRHRRTVVRTDDVWLVADHLVGAGDHRLDAHWHVDPAWTPVGEYADAVQLYHPDGLWAAFASTAREQTQFHGDAAGLGWCAPVYGQLVASVTLRFSHTGAVPLSLISAIAAAEHEVAVSIETAPVAISGDDDWHRSAVVGRCGSASLVAVFATPAAADRELQSSQPSTRRAVQQIAAAGGEFATDARVAVLWLSPAGEPTSLLLLEGTTASWNGRGGFRLPAMGSAADLHLGQIDLARLSLAFERFFTVSADGTLCAE